MLTKIYIPMWRMKDQPGLKKRTRNHQHCFQYKAKDRLRNLRTLPEKIMREKTSSSECTKFLKTCEVFVIQ